MMNKIKKIFVGGLHQIVERASAGNSKIVYISLALMGIALFVFAFNGFGFVKPVNSTGSSNIALVDKSKFQEASMDLTYDGYSPNVIYIKKGIPVRWNIDVKQMTGCTNEIMIESLGIKKSLKVGKNVIEFSVPYGENEIRFSCGMRMVWGKFVITEDGSRPSGMASTNSINDLPTGGCNGNCGSPSCGAAKGGGCGCGKH